MRRSRSTTGGSSSTATACHSTRSRRLPRHHEEVGEGGRQEFVAGAIPLRAVIALQDAPLVLVQHRRGFLRAFDEHLDAVRERAVPCEGNDYQVTWLGMTGGEHRPPPVRLGLTLDGLRAPPRLLFDPGTHEPLWLLASEEQFGLVLEETLDWVVRGPGPHVWMLGPTPVAAQLGRILDEVGILAPTALLRDRRRLRRRIGTTRLRHLGA